MSFFRNCFIFFHNTGDTSCFISYDVIPMILFADIENRFACVKTVTQQEYRQPWKISFHPFGKSLKRLTFTVLLDLLCIHLFLTFCILCIIFYEFRIKTDNHIFTQNNLSFQGHSVPYISFTSIFPLVFPTHTEFILLLLVSLKPRAIDNDHPLFMEPCIIKCLHTDQVIYDILPNFL